MVKRVDVELASCEIKLPLRRVSCAEAKCSGCMSVHRIKDGPPVYLVAGLEVSANEFWPVVERLSGKRQ